MRRTRVLAATACAAPLTVPCLCASDEQQQQLIGKDKGTLFGLGDSVKVKVAGVNMDLLQIDFDLKAKLQSSAMNQSKKGQPKKEQPKKTPAKRSSNRRGAAKKS